MNTENANKYPELIFEFFDIVNGYDDEAMQKPIISGDGMILVPKEHPFYLIDPEDIKIDFKGEFEMQTEVICKRTIKQAPFPESYLGHYCISFILHNFPVETHSEDDVRDAFLDLINKLKKYEIEHLLKNE